MELDAWRSVLNKTSAYVTITVTCVATLAFVLWGLPQLGVYNRTLAGKAALMEAESTRQVRVLEAKARQEAAALEAQAEITKAEGSAKAIAAVKDQLGGPDGYLRWLYLQGLQEPNAGGDREKIIYIPTDGLVPLPISEAGRTTK